MMKFSMYTMQMSASAACADAASACARTMADSYVIFLLDAIFVASIIIFRSLGNCVLGILVILAVLGILLVCGKANPSEARWFA